MVRDTTHGCVDPKGEVVSQSRALGKFERIRVDAPITVRFSQGAPATATVRGHASFAELVTLRVVDGEFVVGVKKGTCFVGGAVPSVTITAPTLARVTLSSSGSFDGMTPVTAKQIDLQINGSGRITLQVAAERVSAHVNGSGAARLRGRTADLRLQSDGSGGILARRLAAKRAVAIVGGSGSIEVQASESLTAGVRGSGDIDYWGKPSSVERMVSGSGKIEARE